MKKSWIFVPVAITLLFVIFLAGVYLGRNYNHQPVQVPLVTKATASAGSATTPAPGHPVNINTATKAELMTVPGIGPTLAQRIIDYRTLHGKFTAVAELCNVDGIGEKTLDSIRPYITV